jgi:eukaryotic-like serine/threonine-protein kinase
MKSEPFEYESTVAAPQGPELAQTELDPPDAAPVGFEHRRLKEAVRQELFGHAAPVGRIGRFTILRRLGAGGMGVVYSAYDDELERKVAIKLLRTDRRGETAESRLRREAQAIARLSHPNVIGVYEVGRHGGALFVAMEFVRGQTLREWSKERRTTAEICSVYLQAAAGLQAAHEAGIVHRDFKPDNVMIGDEGRVRVLDFGLAAPVGDAIPEADPESEPGASSKLTITGTVMGTPHYMAPEQRAGRIADARSDQYGFCVSLWEALHGRRPGSDDGSPSPSDVPAMPSSIRRALLRGLAADPAERWDSMKDLMRALDQATHPKRRRLLGAAGLAAASLLGAGALWAASGSTCPDPASKLADVWSRPRIEAARAAVAASASGFSLSDWQTLERELDGHAARWSQALEASCAGELSEQERLEQQLCLEQDLEAFRTVVDTLGRGTVPS